MVEIFARRFSVSIPNKFLFCLISLCIGVNSIRAQNEVDSLHQVLQETISDTARINTLNRLAEIYIYSNPHRSLELANEALQLSNKIKFQLGQAVSHNRLGSAYWSLGDLANGLNHFNSAYEIAIQLNDVNQVARTIGRIALIYSSAGMYTISIDYEKEALKHFIKLNNTERLMVLYNNIGKDFLELEQLDSARYYTEKAYALMTKVKIPTAIIPLKLAEIALKQNNFESCQNYLNEVYEQAIADQDSRSLSRYYQISGELNLAKNNIKDALAFSKRAVKIADSTMIMELQFTSYNTHSRILAALKNFTEAFQYQSGFIKFRDSLKSTRQQNLLTLREFNLKETELLKIKLAEDLAEAQAQTRLIIIIGLAVLLSIATLVIWNINRLRYRKQKLNETLSQKNQELELSKQELEQKNEQLNRISNFKDKVLSVLSHDIRGPIKSARVLLDLHQNGRIAQNELQTFLAELAVKLDVLTGLTSTLLAWAKSKFDDQLIKYTSFNLKSAVDQVVQGLHLANKNIIIHNEIHSEYTLYTDVDILEAVIRNILSNAIKYSEKEGNIWIRGVITENKFQIIIEDEGLGLPPGIESKLFKEQVHAKQGTSGESGVGIGLLLCRELLVEINGTIWAKNNALKGASFFIEIPVSTNSL